MGLHSNDYFKTAQQREIQIVQDLKHENIVNCKFVTFRDNKYFMVLEYAKAGSLQDMLDEFKEKKKWIAKKLLL